MPTRIDRTATVAQIAAEHGEAAAVFRKYDIDYCCRGEATIDEISRRYHLDPERLVAEVESAIAAASQRAGSEHRQERSLVTHIVEHHHANERRALPYVVSLLAKVAGRHRARNGELDALCDLGQDLADTLEAYLEEEERKLLPALAAGGCEAVRGEMDRHNRELRALLAKVRTLAGGYVAPEWGDRTYQDLMEELEALEEDLVERMHVENHVLLRPAS